MSTKKSGFVDVSHRKKSEALWDLDLNAESREDLAVQYTKVSRWRFDADAEAWNPLTRREAGAIPRPASPVMFAKEQVDRRLEGEEEAEIMKILRKLDKDGGGTISMKELHQAFAQLKMSPDPDLLDVLLRDYDEDNSGELDFTEFIPMYKELTLLMKMQEEQDKDFIDAPDVGDRVLVPKEGGSLVLADIQDVSIVHERTQYTVQLKDGEVLKVGRAKVFTLKEAGVPHEEISRNDLLPALTSVVPPSPRTLYSCGFQPQQYENCRTFCHRHQFRISSWCKGAVTSQGLSVHTEFIALDEQEARAIMEGNRPGVEGVRQRVRPMINSYLNRRHGVIVRLDTTSPADQIIWELCALTAAVLEAKEGAAAVGRLKLHHRKGTVVDDLITATAADMEVGHVPTNEHIKAAQERAHLKEELALEEKRRRGRARIRELEEEEEARKREEEEQRLLLLKNMPPEDAEDEEEEEDDDDDFELEEDEFEEDMDEEDMEDLEEEDSEEGAKATATGTAGSAEEMGEEGLARQIQEMEEKLKARLAKLEDSLIGLNALVDQVDERAAMIPSVENLDAQKNLHRKISVAKAQMLGLKDAHKRAVKALKDKDEDLEMGERLIEEEAEGLERLQWLVRHHLESFVQREIAQRVQAIKQMELSSILQHRNATITCTPLPPPRHIVLRAVSVLQRAARCHQARGKYQAVVAAWSCAAGEIREQGPTQPLERNFVLRHGPSLWAYYRGYSITVWHKVSGKPGEKPRMKEESQLVRRYTSTRQKGDRYQLHAPETDRTKQTIYKELFYMEDIDGYGALTSNDLQRVLEKVGVFTDEEDVEALMSRHCNAGGEWGGKRAHFKEFLEILADESISDVVENTALPDVTVPMAQNRQRRMSNLLSRVSSTGSDASQSRSTKPSARGGPAMRRNQAAVGASLTQFIQANMPAARTGSSGSGGAGPTDEEMSAGKKLKRRTGVTGAALEGLLHGESPSFAGGGGLLHDAAQAAIGGARPRGGGLGGAGAGLGAALRQALASHTPGAQLELGDGDGVVKDEVSGVRLSGAPGGEDAPGHPGSRDAGRRASGRTLVSGEARAPSSKRGSMGEASPLPGLGSPKLGIPGKRGSTLVPLSRDTSKRGSLASTGGSKRASADGEQLVGRRGGLKSPLNALTQPLSVHGEGGVGGAQSRRGSRGAAEVMVGGQRFGGILKSIVGFRKDEKSGIPQARSRVDRAMSTGSAAATGRGRRASLMVEAPKETLGELNQRRSKEEQQLGAKWALFGGMSDLVGVVKRVEPPTAHPRIRNDDEVKDRVAVIDAGDGVPFLLQAWRAQQVGAIGVVVVRQLFDQHPQPDIFPMPEDHTLPQGQSVRIPVVMIKQSDKRNLTDGTFMTLRMHNETKKHSFSTWPHRSLALGEIEDDVRSDWQCMSNLVLKTFRSVQQKLTAVGSQMNDPNHWTEEQLWNSLQRDGWRPVEDKKYNKAELVKDAYNLKCNPPWQKTERVLKVVIVGAHHLPKMERQRRGTNPFVQVKFGGLVRETGRVSHSLDPEWDEEFSFKVTDREVRQKELAIARAKYDALEKDGSIEPQNLQGMFENTQVHIKPEELPPILAKFSESKHKGVTWEDFISLYDEYAGKIEPISIHIMHQDSHKGEKEIGHLNIEVGWLRDGVRISEKMQVLNEDEHEVIGHDGRLCVLHVKVSLFSHTSENFSEHPVTDAMNIVMGSTKTKKDLDTAIKLGLDKYPVHLCVRSFIPALATTPEREFRAFIYEGVLNGISQRHTDLYFPEMETESEKMQELIVCFYWDHLERRLRDLSMGTCIVDLFVDPTVEEIDGVEHRDHVVALNILPFHESTSACLYSWDDPDDLTILKEGRVFGSRERDRIPVAGQEGSTAPNADFRVRKEPLADPVGSLPPVWARWMKNLIRDLGMGQGEVWREGLDLGDAEEGRASKLSRACAIL